MAFEGVDMGPILRAMRRYELASERRAQVEKADKLFRDHRQGDAKATLYADCQMGVLRRGERVTTDYFLVAGSIVASLVLGDPEKLFALALETAHGDEEAARVDLLRETLRALSGEEPA